MSIIVPYRGVVEITGDHDTGKTIAALQTVSNVKDIVFVDDDVKGDGTVRQMSEAGMEFEEYLDLSKLRSKLGNTPTADQLMGEVVIPTIERIKSKKRKVIVWDTWRIVYQSARGHVERNQSKYSNVVNFRGTSEIVQGLISKVARMIEVKLLNDLKSSCELLIVTHHIKDWYVKNVQVGKIPESSTTFSEVCNMRMWLRRNQVSKVPVILFLKRPNLPVASKSGLKFVNVVPLKITPTDKHESIWDAIAEYQKNPIESRLPRTDETPTKEELMAISGTLTPEMQSFVETSIKYQLQMENDLLVAMGGQTTEAAEKQAEKEIKSNVPENAVQLLARAKTEFGLDLKDIELILEMPFAEINSSYNKSYWEVLTDTKREETKKEVKSKKK